MYANQFAPNRGFKPGSMTLALAVTVLPIAGLVMSLGVDRLIQPDKGFTLYPVSDDPPPPPITHPKEKVDTKAPISETPYVPPVDPPMPSDNTTKTTIDYTPPGPTKSEEGNGTAVTPVTPPKPKIIDSTYDQRYANALQPPYPSSEIRSGNSGRVAMRVLIGTDGRVKQVERISAASDAFFAAAERQALTKWRFKPATSDGTPIEQWKTISLRFELQDR